MMILDQTEWRYAETIDDERIPYLRKVREFSAVIADIEGELAAHTGECIFQIEPGDHVPGQRPVFVFPVNGRPGDIFFNGVSGYRAQYYRSPETGSIQNHLLIDLLTPQLLRVAEAKSFADGDRTMSEAQVTASLTLPSAKAWGDECRDKEQFWKHVNAYEDENDIEIRARRWLDNLASPDEAKSGKAGRGVRAPQLGLIKIMGGFIDDDGNEQVAERKRRRACDIFECGFS